MKHILISIVLLITLTSCISYSPPDFKGTVTKVTQQFGESYIIIETTAGIIRSSNKFIPIVGNKYTFHYDEWDGGWQIKSVDTKD